MVVLGIQHLDLPSLKTSSKRSEKMLRNPKRKGFRYDVSFRGKSKKHRKKISWMFQSSFYIFAPFKGMLMFSSSTPSFRAKCWSRSIGLVGLKLPPEKWTKMPLKRDHFKGKINLPNHHLSGYMYVYVWFSGVHLPPQPGSQSQKKV